MYYFDNRIFVKGEIMKTVFKNCSRYQVQKLALGILHELQNKPACNNFEITIETAGGMENVEIKKD